MKALLLIVQNKWSRLKFFASDRQVEKQSDKQKDQKLDAPISLIPGAYTMQECTNVNYK